MKVTASSVHNYKQTTKAYKHDFAKLLPRRSFEHSILVISMGAYLTMAGYEIRDTEEKGRGVFAKRDIKCGDLIIAEAPLFSVPLSLPFLDSTEFVANYVTYSLKSKTEQQRE